MFLTYVFLDFALVAAAPTGVETRNFYRGVQGAALQNGTAGLFAGQRPNIKGTKPNFRTT